ncbi:hypothetical protein [Frigoribacterium sp. PhB24]|uniref:hypothetical protein n=1 Tax=Frigoribacterium sp. PhB24 TaxID=2485204 RepID=UPI000F48A956|nr:hypothetical protein [Frigoribacterium sp. PhB24]ROS48842.1 hypothetical protein EDF50_2626 [Frigoribacterium sp. PhB24]
MRSRSDKTALTTITGAVALVLLLAGCTGGDDDPGDAGPSSSAGRATATADADEQTGRGDVALPADCDTVATALGGAVEGLTLDSTTSRVEDGEAACTWTSEVDRTRIGFYAQVAEYTEAEMDAALPDSDGLSLERVENDDVDSLGGRLYVGSATPDAPVSGGGAVIITPHGTVGVLAAAPAGSATRLDTDQMVDASLAFVR